jgi:hypothetical protein
MAGGGAHLTLLPFYITVIESKVKSLHVDDVAKVFYPSFQHFYCPVHVYAILHKCCTRGSAWEGCCLMVIQNCAKK